MALSFSRTSLSITQKCFPSKTPTTKSTILNLLSYKPHNLNKFSTISKPNSFSLTITKLSKNPKPKSHLQPVRSLFTGIVEEMGTVQSLGDTKDGGFDLKIEAKTVLEGVHLGDSIAVNGTCLTVTDFTNEDFTVGLSPETLRKTSLIELKTGSLVNLERAVQPDTRMGGHFVQGHVDGTGVIVEKEPEGDSLWIKVKADKGLLKYIVPKGFIAVDGTSLTVVDVMEEEECFNFMLVAYTQQKVVIPLKEVSQKVNLEVDILGKYVERLLSSGFVDSFKGNLNKDDSESCSLRDFAAENFTSLRTHLGLLRDLLALLVLGAYLHDNSGFGVEKRSCASSSLFGKLMELSEIGALPIELVQCQLRLTICPDNSSLLQTISIPELCLVEGGKMSCGLDYGQPN
ncbi:riboflavin synthase-like [Populus alba x Populus x berolinensis]|nr:riboflavin synthase-like [Populus alba x Populus x berolinensis]